MCEQRREGRSVCVCGRAYLGVAVDVGDGALDASGVGPPQGLAEQPLLHPTLVEVHVRLLNGAVPVVAVVRRVAHLVLLDDAAFADHPVEGHVDGGALASARAAALVRVGHARNELLGGEVEERAGLDGDVRLEGGGGGEGPAGAAAALVLDGRDDALRAPVGGLGEVLGLVNGERKLLAGEGPDVARVPRLVAALGVTEVALVVGHVGELVHALLVGGGAGSVVGDDVLRGKGGEMGGCQDCYVSQSCEGWSEVLRVCMLAVVNGQCCMRAIAASNVVTLSPGWCLRQILMSAQPSLAHHTYRNCHGLNRTNKRTILFASNNASRDTYSDLL